MNPNPYSADHPVPERPTPERTEAFAGMFLFFGIVAMLFAAIIWGAIGTFAPAPALATGGAGLGIIMICAGYKFARVAGYKERERDEWDRRYRGPEDDDEQR